MNQPLRNKDTGTPGNRGRYAHHPRPNSGLDLERRRDFDLADTAVDDAEDGLDPTTKLIAAGLTPTSAAHIAQAAHLAAAYSREDADQRAFALDPHSAEAIVSIEEFKAPNTGERYEDGLEVGYDYPAWAEALAEEWASETRIRTRAARATATQHPAAA